MLLETGGEVRFQVRPVENVSFKGPLPEPERLILDGQQRLTSLTQVLALDAPVRTFNEKGKRIDRYYYVDIEAALDNRLDEAFVAVEADKTIKTNFGRDIKLHTNSAGLDIPMDFKTAEKECKAFFFPCNQILNSDTWEESLQEHAPENFPTYMKFRKQVLIPPALIQTFEQHLEQKQFQEAYELAKNDDSYLGQVLAAGMGKLQSGYGAAVEALQAEEGEQAMKLEHKISYVSLVGALAPMFGLLGTVDGMVAAFMIIAKSSTAPKPNELAIGISQALITTLIGLWLAIPAIACFALFKNWLQKLNGDVDTEAMRLMSRFQNMGKK
jgi:biopolymer transport protein ExbB/TolQ